MPAVGRLPTALLLTGLVLALGACTAPTPGDGSPTPKDTFGPISDFPHTSGGGPGGMINDPSRTPDAGLSLPPSGGGGTVGGGEFGTPGGTGDAGVSYPSLDAGGGWSDAQVPFDPDAGDADAGEGGSDEGDVDAGDGGCLSTSDQRDAGGCYGQLCNTSLSQLRNSTNSGACNDPDALALACDGQISRAAAECAQSNTSSLWFDNAVRSCLRSSPTLRNVPRACLDCYSEELLCTLSRCLVACVSDLHEECRSCRNQHCAASFQACSGIATP